MSAREWKPGDVAIVRNRWGVWNLAVCSVERRGFVWRFGVTDATEPINMEARPLLVIDPEDRGQVERVAETICAVFGSESDRVYADGIQRALRSLLAPPKCGARISLDYGEQGSTHDCEEPEGHDGPHAGSGLTWMTNETRP